MKRLLIILLALTVSGCAATQVALEKRHLDVQTKMSETIFLDPVGPDKRVCCVVVKNTSDKDIDIAPQIKSAIEQAGYAISTNPDVAHYMLQVNILSVGKADPSALREALHAGYGGPLAGGLAGAVIAGNAAKGAAVGGIIGGFAEVVAGSLVKDVTYAIVTDIQVSEKSDAPVEQVTDSTMAQGTSTTIRQHTASSVNWKRYRTRVISSANKVNLKFEDALPEIEQGLSKSIAGLF